MTIEQGSSPCDGCILNTKCPKMRCRTLFEWERPVIAGRLFDVLEAARIFLETEDEIELRWLREAVREYDAHQ